MLMQSMNLEGPGVRFPPAVVHVAVGPEASIVGLVAVPQHTITMFQVVLELALIHFSVGHLMQPLPVLHIIHPLPLIDLATLRQVNSVPLHSILHEVAAV